MARMTVVVRDDLYVKFRETVHRLKGYGKGVVSKAVEEAIKLWLDQNSNQREIVHPKPKQQSVKVLLMKLAKAMVGDIDEFEAVIEGIPIRSTYGKFGVPFKHVEPLYNSKELQSLMEKHNLYATISVVDEENWVFFIPKLPSEYHNSPNNREMIKQWIAKNFGEFTKSLITLIKEKRTEDSKPA